MEAPQRIMDTGQQPAVVANMTPEDCPAAGADRGDKSADGGSPPSQQFKEDPADASDQSSSLSDVETFNGKIVYNPDGSAFIIETATAGDSDGVSDEDCSLDLPHQEGSIVDGPGVTPPPIIPQVVNAFHISRNPALYSALYGQAYSLLQEKKKVPEVPIMHSYRVFSVRDQKNKDEKGTVDEGADSASDEKRAPRPPGWSTLLNTSLPLMEHPSVPIKPILMCFICKLSFGFTKSFVGHAIGEHGITLTDEERHMMNQKNISAIIQGVGKDKEPLLSFLEPLPAQGAGGPCSSGKFKNPIASGSSSSSLAPAEASVGPLLSVNTNGPDTASAQDARESPQAPVLTPPGSSSTSHRPDETLAPELEDLANIEKIAKAAAAAAAVVENPPMALVEKPVAVAPPVSSDPVPRTSPPSAERPMSTGSSSSPGVSPKLLPQAPFLNACASPVIACPQHPDGKTNGVECPKCDTVLGSSRSLGGHMTMMHSRNSCKTLKCPKCNWHYKYQETLEIHMKEKHPENELNCIYCLTSQPHPRLARGETYTCGYKPYRCEVCNYSTTTKGNLSIHMQSDKHINNIQELQNGNLQATPEQLLQQQQPPQQQQPQGANAALQAYCSPSLTAQPQQYEPKNAASQLISLHQIRNFASMPPPPHV